MRKTGKKLMVFLISAVLFPLVFAGCAKFTAQNDVSSYKSYRDIPNITQEEIEAIEKLKKEHSFFVYGMTSSIEAFYDYKLGGGEVRGFAALFSQWLSKLFQIPFKPAIFEWDDLISGLESGEIDFTGDLTPTDVRRERYFMTQPIAQRTLQYFRIADAVPLSEIAKMRPLRFAFLDGAITHEYVVSSRVHDEFEVFFVDNKKSAYELLKSGEIDAFIDESVIEAAFDAYNDVVSTDYFPLRYSPVSFMAQNPAYEPIISVIQKALEDNGTARFLNKIYKQGYYDYRLHKFLINLTEEEKEYIRRNPVIPFAAEYYNYPISFYNRYEKQWQGIFFDALEKVSELTSLSFKQVNDNRTPFSKLVEMLRSGKVYMAAELIPTEERRAAGFLWASIPTMTDNYALISKSETPTITLREIANVRVAVSEGTAYAEKFYNWFPNHPDVVEYPTTAKAFAALDRGEVDMVMASQRLLLSITNYYEFSGYKANLVFDYTAASFIGFNQDQELLASIVSKALAAINIKNISTHWTLKTYDYKGKIAKVQRPWLIGASILLLFVLILLFVLFQKNRLEGKRLEALVKKRTAEVEAANKAKTMFLAKMSHEIRTPMNAIVGMTELALREELPPRVRENANAVQHAAAHLLSIINDILDISKIESGKLEIVPTNYLLSSLINDVVSIIKTKLADSDSKIRLITNIDSKIPNSLFGDETRIRQILLNILGNAVKYTEKGSITFSLNGEIVNNQKVILFAEVSDTGRGIKSEDITKLFSDFVQVDLAANKGVEGTGLGLAITQNLVRLMDGDIKVESIYGEGSKFSITLPQGIHSLEPVAELNLNTEHINAIKSKIETFSAPNAKVLVVDDIGINLRVAKGLLAPYNMKIDLCLSGSEAIEKIKNNHYDLVFMDHMMPEMDGMEAVKQIREFSPNLTIIALTANAVSGMREKFIENGFNDFLSKPIDTRKLNDILEKWIPRELRKK